MLPELIFGYRYFPYFFKSSGNLYFTTSKHTVMNRFISNYGPWALVAGASEGFLMSRLLPRKKAISIMHQNTKNLS